MEETLPVLIVDGDQHMREMLQRFLTHLGIEARTAVDIAEAQTLLARYIFSVVLTELFWPHKENLSLLRYIHATAPDTRVVAMSSFMAHEVQHSVLVAGAYATIGKPFPLQKLAALLQQILPGGQVLLQPFSAPEQSVQEPYQWPRQSLQCAALRQQDTRSTVWH